MAFTRFFLLTKFNGSYALDSITICSRLSSLNNFKEWYIEDLGGDSAPENIVYFIKKIELGYDIFFYKDGNHISIYGSGGLENKQDYGEILYIEKFLIPVRMATDISLGKSFARLWRWLWPW